MQEVEKSAASVEEAIEAALEELGLSEQEAHVEIVQEPRSGFLGLNSQPAVVRVRGVGRIEYEPAELDEQGALAVDFLTGLLETMGLDADVEVNEVEGITYIDVWGVEEGQDMGLLIGKQGHTLEALQELVRGRVQRQTEQRCRVLVDVEDYRKRRRSRVVRRAREAARKVRKTGRPEALEPMTAYERKLVHDTVGEIGGLETVSEGQEPQRRVVIRRRR
jgi:spoIIIJ-associated protein